MRTFLPAAAATMLCVALAAPAAGPVDNCATVLGSLAIELRFARGDAPGKKTTFACARRYTPLIGASRERVRRALGPPDRSGEDGGWSYLFASRYSEVPAGTPELVFHFDGEGTVESVDCRRTAA